MFIGSPTGRRSVTEDSEELTLEQLRAARNNGIPAANHMTGALAKLTMLDAFVLIEWVLHRWLSERHEMQATVQCGRVARSLHRNDPDLAVGVALPAPPPGIRYGLVGHQQIYKKAVSASERQAALATACSSWFFAKRLDLQGDVLCMCGLKWPSRTHIRWTCPALSADQPAIPTPSVVLLETAVEKSPHQLLVATDGSSQTEVGSYAIISEDPPFEYTNADESEDQSPFRMELLGLVDLLTSVAALSHLFQQLVVLVDCESAWTWHWQPPFQLDAALKKRLNERADNDARRHCAARCISADRQQWDLELTNAKALEDQGKFYVFGWTKAGGLFDVYSTGCQTA
ncbi:gcs-1, partial [Symbiodinium sp. CCMP2592]